MVVKVLCHDKRVTSIPKGADKPEHSLVLSIMLNATLLHSNVACKIINFNYKRRLLDVLLNVSCGRALL